MTPDTVNGRRDLLDVNIDCTFDRPLEARVEVNASSKSNSYIGPGVTLGLTNRNLFGGGELLSVTLTGSYEWQTGHDRRSVFNSYEVGLSGSLSFPRLLAPKFVRRSRRNLNWTRITLNADLLNRPHYFRMAQLNASFNYDWQSGRYSTRTFTPLKLTYTKLLNTTHDFDSIMTANPAVAQSFKEPVHTADSLHLPLRPGYRQRQHHQLDLYATGGRQCVLGIVACRGHQGREGAVRHAVLAVPQGLDAACLRPSGGA